MPDVAGHGHAPGDDTRGMLAVFSDSHGNLALLNKAVKSALGEGATVLVHLGDEYSDLAEVDTRSASVWRVPGLRCPEMRNPFIDNVLSFEFAGWRILAVHDCSMAPGAEGARELVLYGHTHIPDCEKRPDGRWYCNPGHLKAVRDRGADAGYALVRALADGRLEVRFRTPEGKQAKSVDPQATLLD